MTVQWLGQAQLPLAERRRAEALFPSCYTQAFDRCLKIKKLSEASATGFPDCVELSQLYPPGSRDSVLDAKIQNIPFCPAPSKAPYIIAVAAIATTLILASRNL